MKGTNGVQMNVHPKFLEICKDIQDDRVKKGKERSKELSHKRLTLTLFKLLKHDLKLYEIIVDAEIDKNEI
jgi:hypothetical protein